MNNLSIKNLLMILTLLLGAISADASGHTMQHGFILSLGPSYAEHLVAQGHHSHQVVVEVDGFLIPDPRENSTYYSNSKRNEVMQDKYFVLLAQNLDLEAIKAGDVLSGPIAEMDLGQYQPGNIIVKNAQLTVKSVLLNVENPFFKDAQ